jgi:L-2-hydroxyglutarate oxidase
LVLKNKKIFDVTIVGGGIVGAATAFKIQSRNPGIKILLIEKESHLAFHQTGNNSGVIHSGLYYKPGSTKARTCIDGRHQLVKFAKKHKIKHDICGKVVIAVTQPELSNLEKLYQNGLANKIEGIEKLTREEVKEIEPHVECLAGIRVPCTGIIDYRHVTEKLCDLVKLMQPLSSLVLGEEVRKCIQSKKETKVITQKNTYRTKYMVFCAGLQADRLAKKNGIKLKERIVGFRGDYYQLTDNAKMKVKNLIYPVPDPAFPFLGVHFTRMVNGKVECGPNAVFTFKREGYNKTDFNLRDSLSALTYSGTWNLFRHNMGAGLREYQRAFSKKRFLKTLQRMIPSLNMKDIEPGRAGVRALLLSRDGNTRDDFRIENKERSIHVLNAPSPAATACLAIGDEICDMAGEQFDLN